MLDIDTAEVYYREMFLLSGTFGPWWVESFWFWYIYICVYMYIYNMGILYESLELKLHRMLIWIVKNMFKHSGAEYSRITRSIPWVLMPWSPSHQHPWYWLCRISRIAAMNDFCFPPWKFNVNLRYKELKSMSQGKCSKRPFPELRPRSWLWG